MPAEDPVHLVDEAQREPQVAPGAGPAFEFQEGADREGVGPQVAGRRRAADQTGASVNAVMSCRTAAVVAGSFVTMGNSLFSVIARFAPLWTPS